MHSFRHSMRDRLRAVSCPSEMVDQIGGRSNGQWVKAMERAFINDVFFFLRKDAGKKLRRVTPKSYQLASRPPL